MNTYYTYILANASRILYVGVTHDLLRRMSEHRLKLIPDYATRYNIKHLVHYEASADYTLTSLPPPTVSGRWR